MKVEAPAQAKKKNQWTDKMRLAMMKELNQATPKVLLILEEEMSLAETIPIQPQPVHQIMVKPMEAHKPALEEPPLALGKQGKVIKQEPFKKLQLVAHLKPKLNPPLM